MFKKFRSYYKPHKGLLIFVLMMVTGFTLIELSIPHFTRLILNDYIPSNDIKSVLMVASIMIVLMVFYGIFQYFVGYKGHILGISMESDMRIKAFEKLQELGLDYYDTNKTGEIMAKLTTDLHMTAELAHHGIEELLSVSLMLIVGYIYLIQLNFLVTTILFVLFLFGIGLLMYSRRNMIISFRKLRSEHAKINSRLESTINGVRLTKAFSNEEFEINNFKEDNNTYIKAYDKAYDTLGKTNGLNNFFIQLMSIIVLIAGALLVLTTTSFTSGDMFAYFLYFGLLTGPIKKLVSMLEQFQQGWAGFERYIDLMDTKVSITDKIDAITLEDIKGNIKLNNVSFKYNSKDDGVLEKFTLTIPKGKMYALVGPSGVGKTTISQLLLRFYDVNSGSISIDDIDIRDVTIKSLRNHIGYIQQDIVLFYGSIADNIKYGNPNATISEVIEASKLAGVSEFVDKLPNGYETLVGERGATLSGGQKQRISIARIFLKNPKIIILDEATSALDNITEAYVQQSIEVLAIDRTVIVIAHRLSTIQKADMIVVMSNKGIAQMGHHNELINTKGHYKKLYEASKNNILDDSRELN